MIPDLTFDLEIYEIDLQNNVQFRGLTIQQHIDLIYFLDPIQDEATSKIIEDFLIPEFNMFDNYGCYYSHIWHNISLFTTNLLLQRSLQNLFKNNLKL